MRIYSAKDKAWVDIPDENVQDAVISGQYGFAKGFQVPVESPDGKPFTVDSSEAAQAFRQGYKFQGVKELTQQINAEQFGSPGQQVQAGVEGVLRGALPFVADPLLTRLGVDPYGIKQRQEQNPWTSYGSEAVGTVASVAALPGASIPGLIGKVGTGIAAKAGETALSKLGYRALGTAAEGGFYGAAQGVSQNTLATEEDLGNPETVAEKIYAYSGTIGTTTIIGGVIGGVIGAILDPVIRGGLGYAAKKAGGYNLGDTTAGGVKTTSEIIGAIGESVPLNTPGGKLIQEADNVINEILVETHKFNAPEQLKEALGTGTISNKIFQPASRVIGFVQNRFGSKSVIEQAANAQDVVNNRIVSGINSYLEIGNHEPGFFGSAVQSMTGANPAQTLGVLTTKEGREMAASAIMNAEQRQATRLKVENGFTKLRNITWDMIEHVTKISKYREIEEPLSRVNFNEARGQTDELLNKIQTEMDKYAKLRSIYSPHYVDKVQLALNDFKEEILPKIESSYDLFTELDNLKRTIQRKIKWNGEGTPEIQEGVNAMKGIQNKVLTFLEDQKLWGKAGEIQSEINGAAAPSIKSMERFENRFVNKYDEIDPGRVMGYLRDPYGKSLGGAENNIRALESLKKANAQMKELVAKYEPKIAQSNDEVLKIILEMNPDLDKAAAEREFRTNSFWQGMANMGKAEREEAIKKVKVGFKPGGQESKVQSSAPNTTSTIESSTGRIDLEKAKSGSVPENFSLKSNIADITSDLQQWEFGPFEPLNINLLESTILKGEKYLEGLPEKTLNTPFKNPRGNYYFYKFIRWTKVVNKEKKPIFVYHGTSSDFKAFSKLFASLSTGDGSEWNLVNDMGFFFTESPIVAENFAKLAWYSAKNDAGPNILKGYLSIIKPKEYKSFKQLINGIKKAGGPDSLVENLKRQGYDGIKLENIYDGGAKSNQWIAFDRGQFKVFTNKGMWNKADPRMLYAAAPIGIGGASQFAETENQDPYSRATSQINQLVSNPNLMTSKLSENFAGIADNAPKLAEALHSKTVQAIQFLKSKMPENPFEGQTFIYQNEYMPSDYEKSSFMSYLEAVRHPLGVLDEMQKGVLSSEKVDVLKNIYPELYMQIKQEITSRASENPKLSYEKQLILGQLFDMPVNPAMQPAIIASMQAVYDSMPNDEGQVKRNDKNFKGFNSSTSIERIANS